MLTQRGIEVNPEKCQAVLQMRSPRTIKEVQQLTGRVTALSRFMTRSAHRTLPLYNLLKKGKDFRWTDECEAAFQGLKTTLTEPPILTRPDKGEPLFPYLAVGDRAVSAALVRETPEGQRPVYFTSKILQGPELRYQRLEKVAYALLVTARRLRHYFQAHPIVVRTDLPLRQVLHKPDLAGRLVAWSNELSEHDIR